MTIEFSLQNVSYVMSIITQNRRGRTLGFSFRGRCAVCGEASDILGGSESNEQNRERTLKQ